MEKNPFVKEKTKDLIIISSIISILLLGILFTQVLNDYDRYMVYSLLIIDFIFINSAIQEKSRVKATSTSVVQRTVRHQGVS